MAEAFRVGAMLCGMPRTAPEAQHAAADRAPACSFHRFGKDTPGKARVAEKYDASRKTPLRDSAIRKRPGRRIIRRDSRKFALLPHEASEPRKSVVVRPLLQSPAHSLAAPMRRACAANPRTAQIRPSLLRKAEVAASLPAGPLGEIPGSQRARTAPSCGKAAPHDSAVRLARLAASAQKPQARSADAHPAPQPRCSSAP